MRSVCALLLVAVLVQLVGFTTAETAESTSLCKLKDLFASYRAWSVTHSIATTGHVFNGSFSLNVTLDAKCEDEVVLGTLYGMDKEDREWEYQLVLRADDAAEPAATRLDFDLLRTRFYNRQTDEFEAEDPWDLKPSKAYTKRGGAKSTTGAVVKSFPPSHRSFVFSGEQELIDGGAVALTGKEVSAGQTKKAQPGKKVTVSSVRGIGESSAHLIFTVDGTDSFHFVSTSIAAKTFWQSNGMMLVFIFGFLSFRMYRGYKDQQEKFAEQQTTKAAAAAKKNQ